ncbi:MAG: radical SAM family heme chaperone HemW [Methylomonas sp.]|jgi:oxygen-independent coproporphyrinogen-3 oxidase|uniref:radical SAM family heme chaperone HemW n=1 Tax=Methylomonas sp. TaxID=418 RepID=UPI0025D380C8|nr:radical SAM family heme chaperone HemW [Methylomonas sp.]MCK9606934.1 radical SAM family heme chaperone HemW [Methylomonas sp.]
MPLPPLSLYIHFPWCIQKCPYCDFNSHAVKSGIPEQRYVTALLADLHADLQLLDAPRAISSIFMGGGTPSLFTPETLQTLLSGIRQQVNLSDDCEVTLEANPGTFESAKFKAFRELGINRLSIGIQSFNDRHLKKLGRVHNAEEAIKAVEIARLAAFENLNLDLMFGLPEQTEDQALEDIHTAISLKPSHLSFYQLTLEPNTYFYKFPPQLPEDDSIFALQKACQQVLAESGYRQYEISAYATAGFECRHNRNYWQFGDYLGIGAGAHGKISRALPQDIIRTAKPKSPEQYLKNPTAATRTPINLAQLPLEFMMNHLRLKTGFNLIDYARLTGQTQNNLQPALQQCIEQGLLIRQQQQVFCSESGWDFLDEILEKFIP